MRSRHVWVKRWTALLTAGGAGLFLAAASWAQCDLSAADVAEQTLEARNSSGDLLWSQELGLATAHRAVVVSAESEPIVLLFTQPQGLAGPIVTTFDCSGAELTRTQLPAIECASRPRVPFPILVSELPGAGPSHRFFAVSEDFFEPYQAHLRSFDVSSDGRSVVDRGIAELESRRWIDRADIVGDSSDPSLLVFDSELPGQVLDFLNGSNVSRVSLPPDGFAPTCVRLATVWRGRTFLRGQDITTVESLSDGFLRVHEGGEAYEFSLAAGQPRPRSGEAMSLQAQLDAGSYRVQVRDASGALLWEREYEPPLLGADFVPLVEGVGIVVYRESLSTDVFDGNGVFVGTSLISPWLDEGSRLVVSEARLGDAQPGATWLGSRVDLDGQAQSLERWQLSFPSEATSSTIDLENIWSKQLDGLDAPPLSAFWSSGSLQPDRVVLSADSSRYEFDLATGDVLVPTWLGDALILEDGRTIRAFDQRGAIAWDRTLPSSVRILERQLRASYGWKLGLLRDPVDRHAPLLETVDANGTTTESVVMGPPAPGTSLSLGFDQEFEVAAAVHLVGLTMSATAVTDVHLLDLGSDLDDQWVAEISSPIAHVSSSADVVLVGGEGSEGAAILRSFFLMGTNHVNVDVLDFDGSDDKHPLVDTPVQFVGMDDPDLVIGIAPPTGGVLEVSTDRAAQEPPRLSLKRVTFAGQRTNGSVVEWFRSDGATIQSFDFGMEVSHAVQRGGATHVLEQSSTGPRVQRMLNFEDAAVRASVPSPVFSDLDGPAKLRRFVDHEPRVISGGDFVYWWPQADAGESPFFVYRAPAEAVQRISNLDVVAGRALDHEQLAMFGFDRQRAAVGPMGQVGPLWIAPFDGSDAFLPRAKTIYWFRVFRWLSELRAHVQFADNLSMMMNVRTGRPVAAKIRRSTDSRRVVRGEEFKVAWRVGDAPGLLDAQMDVRFDSDFVDLLAINPLGAWEDKSPAYSGGDPLHVSLTRPEPLGLGNYVEEQALFQLLFRLKENVPIPASLRIGIDSKSVDLRRSDASSMPVAPPAGQVLSDFIGSVICPGADLDGRWGISTSDAVVLLRHLIGLETITDSDKLCWADLNGDGFVDVADAIWILQNWGHYPKSPNASAVSGHGLRWEVVDGAGGPPVIRLTSEVPLLGYLLEVSTDTPVELSPIGPDLAAGSSGADARLVVIHAESATTSVRVGFSGAASTVIHIAAGYAITADGQRVEWPAQLIELKDGDTPIEPLITALDQNRPNPFNPSTEIRYSLAHGQRIMLTVYDASGRVVCRLEEGQREAGPHTVTWRGEDDGGRPVASGVYWYRLTTVKGEQVRKMVLVR